MKKEEGKFLLCNGGKLARDVRLDGSKRASSSSSEFSLTCSTELDFLCRFSDNNEDGCGDDEMDEDDKDDDGH